MIAFHQTCRIGIFSNFASIVNLLDLKVEKGLFAIVFVFVGDIHYMCWVDRIFANQNENIVAMQTQPLCVCLSAFVLLFIVWNWTKMLNKTYWTHSEICIYTIYEYNRHTNRISSIYFISDLSLNGLRIILFLSHIG